LRDAHAHCKLVAACGLSDKMDGGYQDMTEADAAADFLDSCISLRFWDREMTLPR